MIGSGLGIVDITGFPANTPYPGPTYTRTLQPLPSGTFGGAYTTMTIDFAVGVREVLLGWFDPNFTGNVFRAYDVAGNLLEQAAVATGATGGVHAAYIGIQRTSNDIWTIEVVPAASNDVYSIDHVHIYIPGPAALSVMLAGALVAARRRH